MNASSSLQFHVCDYATGSRIQDEALARLRAQPPRASEFHAFCFAPVFTFGRNATTAHLLYSEEELAQRGVAVTRSDRGGEVTYHGPQQLVLYPLVRLDAYGLSIKTWVELLERAMSEWLSKQGLIPCLQAGVPGVFVGSKKIGFLGLRVREGISTHGLSINLGGDLSPFEWMNPCGHSGLTVTSLAAELAAEPVDFRDAAEGVHAEICALLTTR